MSASRVWGVVVVAIAAGALLAGCVADRGNTMPIPVPAVSSSASASPGVADDPEMLPGGTALANRDYFDFVNNRLLAVNANPAGQTIIDNLVAAGFDKAAMQVTPDKTSELRRPVDSIEFSVLIGSDCLIGQFSGGAYHGLVGPVLSGGVCLVGKTRPIDW